MHLKSVRVCPETFPVRDAYPFKLELLQAGPKVEFTAPVTFFCGENGSGKSTFLSAIAKRCGIHLWKDNSRERVVNNPHEEMLFRHIAPEWTRGPVPGGYFSSDVFKYFTQYLDEWAAHDPGQLKYFGGESLLTKSHGQSLMAYFKSRYKIEGLYFLDEPETALSPKTQVELLALLSEAAKGGSAQFIVVTHSPILLACEGAVIWNFDSAPLSTIAYEDTAHYQVYRDFLDSRGKA